MLSKSWHKVAHEALSLVLSVVHRNILVLDRACVIDIRTISSVCEAHHANLTKLLLGHTAAGVESLSQSTLYSPSLLLQNRLCRCLIKHMRLSSRWLLGMQEAAGTFAELRDVVSLRVEAPRPVDVSPEAANMLEKLCLAQAQEVTFEKFRADGKSPSILARCPVCATHVSGQKNTACDAVLEAVLWKVACTGSTALAVAIARCIAMRRDKRSCVIAYGAGTALQSLIHSR